MPAVVLVALAGAFWWLTPQAVFGSFPGQNGVIALGGDGFAFGCPYLRIHVMRPDGSGLRPLTPSGTCGRQRWAPDWSPDGQRLLFVDFDSLGVMAADGSGAHHVPLPDTERLGDIDGQPSFSPDGQTAVFSAHGLGRYNIWIAALDGSAAHVVRPGFNPRWSPDGRAIAYTTPSGRLGLLDAGTERVITVRRFAADVLSVDWSPDARRLVMAMYSGHGAGHSLLATVVADTTSRPRRIALPRRLRSRWSLDQAVWSPNGRRIAFSAYRSLPGEVGRMSVWVMRPRGAHLKRVRVGEVEGIDIEPHISWQPIVR